jgi:hypothetical protein
VASDVTTGKGGNNHKRVRITIGGLPRATVGEVELVLATGQTGRGRTGVPEPDQGGQGRLDDVALRRAIESHAVALATRHYQREGWTVADVSANSSYDLHCVNPGGRELRVEVKGTVGRGDAVLVTANEVRHSREFAPNVAPFVVSEITVYADRSCTGGRTRVVHTWIAGRQLSDADCIFVRAST